MNPQSKKLRQIRKDHHIAHFNFIDFPLLRTNLDEDGWTINDTNENKEEKSEMHDEKVNSKNTTCKESKNQLFSIEESFCDNGNQDSDSYEEFFYLNELDRICQI